MVESFSSLTGRALLWRVGDSTKSGYIAEAKDIILDGDTLVLILFDKDDLIISNETRIQDFYETKSKFQFTVNSIKYTLFREYEDDDDFEEEWVPKARCAKCHRVVVFRGECYCNKNDLSVTLSVIEFTNEFNYRCLLFNKFGSELFETSYGTSPSNAWNKINKDEFSYFVDIIKTENGFYFEEEWIEIASEVTDNKTNETSYYFCSKCYLNTKVYYYEDRWLCKPCQLALENKKKGYI